MKVFAKYSLLLLLAVIYLIQQVDAPCYVEMKIEQEHVVSNEKEAFEQLAMLTALNANALPVNSVHEVVNFTPTFRYLPRNDFSTLLEGHKRVFIPYYKYVENDYLDSFASKQDGGYYVFALREILV